MPSIGSHDLLMRVRYITRLKKLQQCSWNIYVATRCNRPNLCHLLSGLKISRIVTFYQVTLRDIRLSYGRGIVVGVTSASITIGCINQYRTADAYGKLCTIWRYRDA